MDMPINHFSYNLNNRTQKQRQFQNLDNYEKNFNKNLIFLQTGNEGELESFYYNTGFAFRLAKTFKGATLFCEHRQYGESLPQGQESFKKKNFQYLNIDQALNDFAYCLQDFKKFLKLNDNTTKVVALGGSQGGLLSLFFRIKYPNLVDIGYAASAPLKEIQNKADPNFFFNHITNVQSNYDKKCVTTTRDGFNEISELMKNEIGLNYLTNIFNLCQPLKKEDKSQFLNQLRNSYVLLSMCNYPYASNFLAPLPAQPLKEACNKTLESLKIYDKNANIQAIKDIRDMVQTSKSLSNDQNQLIDEIDQIEKSNNPDFCHDFKKEYVLCSDLTGCGNGLSALSWEQQACTETPLPADSDGRADMFFDAQWALADISAWCEARFAVSPRPAAFSLRQGGLDLARVTSKVIFTNGDLDPWTDGGFVRDINDELRVFVVQGGAHHLDLRSDHDQDPESVRKVRNQIEELLKEWMDGL